MDILGEPLPIKREMCRCADVRQDFRGEWRRVERVAERMAALLMRLASVEVRLALKTVGVFPHALRKLAFCRGCPTFPRSVRGSKNVFQSNKNSMFYERS
jgi:hypothetical protein